MTTFYAFVGSILEFLSLTPFVWCCALALLFFGFSFFWRLFNKR